MEFDTGDPATNYDNGIISDLEGLVIKRFKNGFGIGFVESWIQQITDDGGSAPAVLRGFRGARFWHWPDRYVLHEDWQKSPRFQRALDS
jgi:hypothetical protein